MVSRLPGLSMLRSTSRCCQFDTFVRIVSGCLMFARFASVQCLVDWAPFLCALQSIIAALLAPTGLPASGQDTPAWMAARPGFGEIGKKHYEEHILDHCINISSVLSIPFLIFLQTCTMLTMHLSRNILPHLAPDLAAVLVLLGPDVWWGKLRLTEATWRSG